MSFKTCFLIDDDADDRDIFQSALVEICSGCVCVSAADGVEAFELLSTSAAVPDFIFLDINMPRMGGHECLALLRSLPHLDQTPIYIYTTSANSAERKWFLNHGAEDVLTKPTSFHALMAMLDSVLNRSSAAPTFLLP